MFESKFILYAIDTETTGLSVDKNDIIEISILRINDGRQKTWYLKPKNIDTIQADALRVNGHKMDDLLLKTDYGKQTYMDVSKALGEIENFFMEDGMSSSDRILVAQNAAFDLNFIKKMWDDCNCTETFPFGRRPFILDTLQLALFEDICNNTRSDYYNLGSLVEKYKVKKEKSHRSDSDTRMCTEVFKEQVKRFKK